MRTLSGRSGPGAILARIVPPPCRPGPATAVRHESPAGGPASRRWRRSARSGAAAGDAWPSWLGAAGRAVPLVLSASPAVASAGGFLGRSCRGAGRWASSRPGRRSPGGAVASRRRPPGRRARSPSRPRDSRRAARPPRRRRASVATYRGCCSPFGPLTVTGLPSLSFFSLSTKTVLRPWSVTIACSRTISAGWGSPIGSRTRTKAPGTMKRLPLTSAGLSILARNRSVPVLRSTRFSVKSTTPWCGKSFSSARANWMGTAFSPWALSLSLPCCISRLIR